MYKALTFIFLASVMILATSCKPRMQKLEDAVYSDNFTYDQKGIDEATELMDLYVEKADADAKGAEAPSYLFKAAELAMNLNKVNKALDLYNKVIYTYPDYEKTPECLFLMAFIYENSLQNFGKAKELYELFLQKYPDHEFADDAMFSLQYLGKSPEELMKEFEAQNADSLQ